MNMFNTTRPDLLAFWLPIAAAFLAVASGSMAFFKSDALAALFGVCGGLAGAGGVIASQIASRNRDEQLRFWINGIARAEANIQEGFGS